MVHRIVEGRGRKEDLDTILDVAKRGAGTTICAFYDGAVGPYISYIEKFRSEFEALIPNTMPKLTVNGKEVEVPAGTNLIEAARARRCRGAALLLPSRASRSRASAASAWWTSRRRRGPRSPATRSPTEGMVVQTETDRVRETRKSIMEFHLINHPLDCPVCDQAGECWLQIYYMKHGLYDPRMTDEKVHKPKAVPLGPHVILDAERCILCSRCVRFCDEITRTGELGIFERGDHSEIGLFPGP